MCFYKIVIDIVFKFLDFEKIIEKKNLLINYSSFSFNVVERITQ